jgi:PAS domain S-box-containing protein
MNVIDLVSGLQIDDARIALELAENEDFSSLIINSSLDGIIAVNCNQEYTIWNPTMERLSGFKKEDILGKRWFDVFPFFLETPVEEAYKQAFLGKTFEVPPMHYNVAETGAQGWFLQTNLPIFAENRDIVGVLVVVRDVTEANMREDALTEEIRDLKRQLEMLRAKARS